MPIPQHYLHLCIYAQYTKNLLSERPWYFPGFSKVLRCKWNYFGRGISERMDFQETTYSFLPPGSGLSWCLTVMASLLTSGFLVLCRKGPNVLTAYSFFLKSKRGEDLISLLFNTPDCLVKLTEENSFPSLNNIGAEKQEYFPIVSYLLEISF